MIITETLFLKNMLSRSCILLIELALKDKNSVKVLNISLGEITVEYDNTIVSREDLQNWLSELGFKIITDPNLEIVEKTKIAAIELIHKSFNTNSLIRNSEYISEKLQIPYDKISRTFSKTTGIPLEKYIILLKIEKAKEMLISNEYSISEISYLMDYSSCQYFSNQFKKIVGVTISQFKENPNNYRIPLEEII